jgi:Ca2+-binding RTX toxin-like protein
VSLDLETDLNKNIGIFQDIAGVPPGTTLLLSFAASLGTGGPINATTNAVLEVYWNGVLVAIVKPSSTVMTQHAFVVVAAEAGTGLNGANRLEFREVGGGSDARGTNLDAVRLNAFVPGADDGENDLNGDSGDDTLIGDAGADSLSGGDGLDVLIGGGGDDDLSGNGDDDTLDGGAGNDTLNGGSGNDTLSGGAGDDIYFVDSSEDVVIEAEEGGTDELRTDLAAFSLAGLVHVENLTGTNIAAGQELTGNALANVITGTAFGDTIDGGAGDDTLRGGDGDDIYIIDDAGTKTIDDSAGTDRVQTSLAAFSIADIASIENLTGTSDTGQTLTGNSGANIITGGAGNDTLDGGAGDDSLSGGEGGDVYVVDSFGDTVTEQAGGGTDEVRTALGSRTDFTQLYALAANVEKLTGTSAGDQGVRDNGLDNNISMGVGNDLVAADQGGEDVVDGGDGDDFLYFGNTWSAGDQAIGGTGYDGLGLMGGGTFVFAAGDMSGIEQLALYPGAPEAGPFAYDITTADANVAAGERLFVNAFSLRAADTLVFDGSAELNGRFTVLGGAGDDEVKGGQKGDHLDGRAGDDVLSGLDGNDVLIGGMGADTLIGGNGRDILLFSSAAESSGVTFDTIEGFDYRVDKIDLHSSVSGWTGDIQSGTLSTATFNSDLAAAVDGALLANSAVLYRPDQGDFAGRAFVVVDADGDGVYKQGLDYVFEIVDPVEPLMPTTGFFA